MSGRPWEAGDVAAVVANPFYAIEIHPSHGRRHPHPLTEDSWIASNERAVAEVGKRRWLLLLLAALKADHNDRISTAPFQIADPYPAITINPGLCVAHEPLIEEGMWVAAGVRGLGEGERVWMSNLLSVLKGAYAGEVPGGYRPA